MDKISNAIKKITRYMLLVGVALLLVGLLLAFNFRGCSFSFGGGINGFVTEPNKTETFNAVEQLYIQADGAKIEMKTDEEATEITVNYYSDDKEVIVNFDQNEANKLTITQKFESRVIRKGGIFLITLPAEHVFSSVVINVAAGEFTANNLQANDLDLTLNAGEIRLESAQAKSLKTVLNAGSFVCNKLLSGQIEVSVNAGSIELEVVGDSMEYTVKTSVAVGDSVPNKTGSTDKYIHADVDIGKIVINFVEV